jgi:hypothetical protein
MSNAAKRDAIASLLEKSCTPTQISNKLGLPRSTVRYWVEKLDVQKVESDITDSNDGINKATSEQLYSFFEQLAPITVTNPPRRKSIVTDSSIAVVIGDTHFGAECDKTLEVFYKVLDELKPGTVVLNGDTVDLLAVSRFPKDVRYDVTLLEERIAYHKFLSTVRKIVGSQTRILETDANHSGNGIEGRWWRFLSERLGPLAALPDVLENLTYQKVFVPDWADVELVPQVELCSGELFIMHGDVVRKMGGASARGMLDKWFTSIIMNHTHRMGATAQRLPGLGNRKDRQVTVYENACACNLTPCYATAVNWQNGFSIVAMDKNNFGVEQVMVNDGVAVVTTLGKTIKV